MNHVELGEGRLFMTQRQTVMLTCRDRPLEALLKRVIADQDSLEFAAVVHEAAELEDAVWRVLPDVIFAVLDEDGQDIVEALHGLAGRCPEVIIFGPPDRSDLMISSIRIGVRDYLPLPVGEADLRRLADDLAARSAPAEAAERGAIIGVMGAKGGVGATVVPCQLAGALQSLGSQTVVVDANLQAGDVALFHDLAPTYGLMDLERDGTEIDRTYLQSLIDLHPSGVGIMGSPLRAEMRPTVRPSRLQDAVSLVTEFNDFVLIDLPGDWGELVIAAVEILDHLMLVTTLDVPSLAHCKLQLRLAERADIPRGRTQVVANKVASGMRLRDRDVREFLGRPLDAAIPLDVSAVMDAIDAGSSVDAVAPRSAVQSSFVELARNLRKICGHKDQMPEASHSGIARVRRLLLGN